MKYRFLYIVWILPAYILFIIIQQGLVYTGTIDTYKNGESIATDVLEFDVKQIAAQSNGYVVIKFVDPDGNEQERKLSLSIQMAQRIIDTPVIPIRYQKGAFQEIVMIPTYSLQKGTSLSNMGVAFIALLVLIIASFSVSRFATRKVNKQDPELFFERIDQ